MSDILDFFSVQIKFNENKSGRTKKFVTSWAGSCAIDFTQLEQRKCFGT